MNKSYLITILYFILSAPLFAQNNAEPLTIKANQNTTITLFFPSAIETVIPPGINYKFDYEIGNTLATLQARKGSPSNLTVITVQGEVFSIFLNYSEKLDTFTYLFTPDQAVGQVNVNNASQNSDSKMVEQEVTLAQDLPKTTKPTIEFPEKPINSAPSLNSDVIKSQNNFDQDGIVDSELYTVEESGYGNQEGDLYESDPEQYYRIFCENNYLQKTIYKRSFRQNKKIIIRLNNILVDREEVYFMLNLENTSKKEYAVNGLSFFIKDKTNNPKILEPVYTFNLQTLIDPESNNEIVYVFKKFPVSNDETLEIVLDEKDGNRMVILPLDYKYLN
ncbi:conjugative transposon protein TraN [Cellulophaga baltica]|uniref:DUF4138 domain-containing protein n=1 Tax=Cellulophaga TaxID=104264 RepID=UPI001C07A46F|nr:MULTISPECIES: DUF4138 domain-containing protein [Cellulophaga]MBU2997466.1 conjugative transposon protein TraN [Cellulophaga baltica]MDO6768863.1 DUF4138 domain-containing protein [Cellulophaga sp. 1_MG-2023]